MDATKIQNTLTGLSDWRTAVKALIAARIADGECFSSGELSADVRTSRPDLRFSVTKLGEFVRDEFYQDSMPHYSDGMGGSVPVSQVVRVTTGLGRTMSGVHVCVYGPDTNTAMNHPFEVNIPDFSGAVPFVPQAPVQTAPVTATPPKAPAVTLAGSPLVGEAQATVHSDGRLCVSRGLFEAFCHLTGTTLRGGDPVYVLLTATEAMITVNPAPGAKSYDLVASRGRIRFPALGLATPFVPGDTYRVELLTTGIRVDLAKVSGHTNTIPQGDGT
jgi:hypothetical protein